MRIGDRIDEIDKFDGVKESANDFGSCDDFESDGFESDELDSDELDSDELDSASEIPETGTTLGWREKVAKMASQVAEREGCEVYDVEFVGSGGNRILRVYIDRIGRDDLRGVSIDDCSNVSRGLNLLLDVDDVVPGGAYHLEVSSPGLERVLRTTQHFVRAVGGRAQVKCFESFADLDTGLDDSLRAKLGKSKQLEGTIRGVEGEGETACLLFDAENGGHVISLKIPLKRITKANTVFVFEKQEKKSGDKKSGDKKSDRKSRK